MGDTMATNAFAIGWHDQCPVSCPRLRSRGAVRSVFLFCMMRAACNAPCRTRYRTVFKMQMENKRPVRLSRAEKNALTRERLLSAAESVVARLGYGGASVDTIAAEAGLSKGAIYSNFATKEELFLELLRVYMERDTAELEKIVKLEPEHLYKALTQWLATMHSDSDCPLLVAELQLHARRSPEFATHYYELQNQQTRTIARILRAYFSASSVGLPIDAIDLASCMSALAHGLSLQRPLPKSKTKNQAGRIIDELLNVLIRK